jgi:hypothetical protein
MLWVMCTCSHHLMLRDPWNLIFALFWVPKPHSPILPIVGICYALNFIMVCVQQVQHKQRIWWQKMCPYIATPLQTGGKALMCQFTVPRTIFLCTFLSIRHSSIIAGVFPDTTKVPHHYFSFNVFISLLQLSRYHSDVHFQFLKVVLPWHMDTALSWELGLGSV